MARNKPFCTEEQFRQLASIKQRERAANENAPQPDRRHSPDFASVYWDGETFEFSGTQRRIVAILWACCANRTPTVTGEYLLLEAEMDRKGNRISDVFRGHRAMGTMIVAGTNRGTWRLAGEVDYTEIHPSSARNSGAA